MNIFNLLGLLIPQETMSDESSKSIPILQASSAQTRESIHDVKDRLDKLVLISMAMWELIRDKTKLTEEDLAVKISEIDMRDGQMDGRAAPAKMKTCPSCNRAMSARHKRCLFCGRVDIDPNPFGTAM